jgi:hypothetical protein
MWEAFLVCVLIQCCAICTLVEGSSLQCAPGTGQCGDNKRKCCPCAAGQYSSLDDQLVPQCVDCEAGHFSAHSGSSICEPCAAGSFASYSGSAECYPCAMGTFQPLPAQADCLIVPAGYESIDLIGATSIEACHPNKYSLPGSTGCKRCPDDTESTVGSSKCTPVVHSLLSSWSTPHFVSAARSVAAMAVPDESNNDTSGLKLSDDSSRDDHHVCMSAVDVTESYNSHLHRLVQRAAASSANSHRNGLFKKLRSIILKDYIIILLVLASALALWGMYFVLRFFKRLIFGQKSKQSSSSSTQSPVKAAKPDQETQNLPSPSKDWSDRCCDHRDHEALPSTHQCERSEQLQAVEFNMQLMDLSFVPVDTFLSKASADNAHDAHAGGDANGSQPDQEVEVHLILKAAIKHPAATVGTGAGPSIACELTTDAGEDEEGIIHHNAFDWLRHAKLLSAAISYPSAAEPSRRPSPEPNDASGSTSPTQRRPAPVTVSSQAPEVARSDGSQDNDDSAAVSSGAVDDEVEKAENNMETEMVDEVAAVNTRTVESLTASLSSSGEDGAEEEYQIMGRDGSSPFKIYSNVDETDSWPVNSMGDSGYDDSGVTIQAAGGGEPVTPMSVGAPKGTGSVHSKMTTPVSSVEMSPTRSSSQQQSPIRANGNHSPSVSPSVSQDQQIRTLPLKTGRHIPNGTEAAMLRQDSNSDPNCSPRSNHSGHPSNKDSAAVLLPPSPSPVLSKRAAPVMKDSRGTSSEDNSPKEIETNSGDCRVNPKHAVKRPQMSDMLMTQHEDDLEALISAQLNQPPESQGSSKRSASDGYDEDDSSDSDSDGDREDADIIHSSDPAVASFRDSPRANKTRPRRDELFPVGGP